MKLAPFLACALLCGVANSTIAQTPEAAPASEIQVGADTFSHYRLAQDQGPPVDYYISKTTHPAPLLLYIQGSGCTPAFLEMAPRQYGSTIFSLTTTALKREFAVMVVDKPYAERRRPRNAGAATGCSDQYNEYFTVEHWVAQIDKAIRHARRLPWVDSGQVVVIGLSEGATVAAALAARNSAITEVALVGASGPTQAYDMLALASAGRNGEGEATSTFEAVDAEIRQILSDPESTSKFAWGHPYRRWSSFMAASSVRNLLGSQARVYLVSGTADASVPISSTEVLYSELLVAGRDVQFRRIPGAGHDLLPIGADFAASFPQLEAEFARITEWAKARPEN